MIINGNNSDDDDDDDADDADDANDDDDDDDDDIFTSKHYFVLSTIRRLFSKPMIDG